MANTLGSPFLLNENTDEVKHLLDNVESMKDLTNVMQENASKTRRYAFGNFENLAPKQGKPHGSESGTVEFRGGRGLRGRNGTKRCIASTIAFIDLFL